jgi:signal transduction histidine kinase
LLFDGQVAGRVTVARDVSERKQVEGQLHQAQQLEAVGILAGGFAHHFNNILAIILGFTQMSLEEVPPGSAMRNNLQEVFMAGRRAQDLVRQILTFSRCTPTQRRPVSLSVLLRDAVINMRATLPATIVMQQHITADPSIVLGDAIELHQVIIQLLANAAEAMEQTGGVLDVHLDSLEVAAASAPNSPGLKPGSYVRYTVRDTGPGIPHNLLDHIFEPFFTTKHPAVRAGMGLAIVQSIVMSYGGIIMVSSRAGAGATFDVYLPRLPTSIATMLDLEVELPTIPPSNVVDASQEKTSAEGFTPTNSV